MFNSTGGFKMSCEKCKEVQDSDITSFYRWKNANVEIRACDEHLKEIFSILTEAQKKKELSEKCPTRQ